MSHKKAESSVEFMVFIGILMVFFVFFVGIVGLNSNDIDESTVFTSANNILNTVTYEINTASTLTGYYREFYIPEKLSNGDDYSITIDTNLRIVKLEWTGGKNVLSNIVASNVSGTINPGNNMIKNQEGEVKINES